MGEDGSIFFKWKDLDIVPLLQIERDDFDRV